jgi:hypothetical protein
VLRSLRTRPWLFAAALGLLLQSLVEFSLQLPAVAALFVVLAACGAETHGGTRSDQAPPSS